MGRHLRRGALYTHHQRVTIPVLLKVPAATGSAPSFAPRHYRNPATRCKDADWTLPRPAPIRGSDGAGATDRSATRASETTLFATVFLIAPRIASTYCAPTTSPRPLRPLRDSGDSPQDIHGYVHCNRAPRSPVFRKRGPSIERGHCGERPFARDPAEGPSPRRRSLASRALVDHSDRPVRGVPSAFLSCRAKDGWKYVSDRRQPSRRRLRRVAR